MESNLQSIKRYIEIPDDIYIKLLNNEIICHKNLIEVLNNILLMDESKIIELLESVNTEVLLLLLNNNLLLDIFIDLYKNIEKFEPERFGKIIGLLATADPVIVGTLIEKVALKYPDIIAETYSVLADDIMSEYMGIIGSIISNIFTTITSSISGNVIEEIARRNPKFISDRLNTLTEYYPAQVGKLLKNIKLIEKKFCYDNFMEVMEIDINLIVENIRYFWIKYTKEINEIISTNIKN